MILFKIFAGSAVSQQAAIDTIIQWKSKPDHELIFNSSPREIGQYMQAVDNILQSPKMKGFDELLTTSMARLKLEFQAVLRRQAPYSTGHSSVTELSSFIDSTACAIRCEDYLVYENPNVKEVTYLRNIAERMSTGGNLGDCIRDYISVRKGFLESELKHLRFEELGIGGSGRKIAWIELKVKIELWIQVSKICIEMFFEREKNLCEEIFQKLGGANAAKDECFVGTVQDFAIRLCGFAESVSLSNQPYDKMVSIFYLYDVFLSILEFSDTLFASESGKGIRDVCLKTFDKIKNDVKRMMRDFEHDVLDEIPSVPDDDGAIHRLTKYVVDQIDLIVSHKKLLTNSIKTDPLLEFGDLAIPKEELGDIDILTFLRRHLILIIVFLLMNLQGKSKKYEDPILGDLFMMNNIHYIVQKIEGSNELHEMIGVVYLNKLREKVEQFLHSYQTSTSNKFLACFEEEGLYSTGCFCPRLSKTALKKRTKDFNDVFNYVMASHSSWAVPDLLLREKIRSAMSKTLVPAYKKFLDYIRREMKAPGDKSIKHSAEDLEVLVLEKLFANSS